MFILKINKLNISITVIFCLLLLTPSSYHLSIPVLTTRGSHYQVGYDMGYTFKNEITEYFTKSNLHTKLLPFVNSTAGKKYYQGFFTTVKECFSQYIDEMQGVADGSGRTFQEVFTLMISSELKAIMKVRDDYSGCSDVYVNYYSSAAICHNEDGDPLVKDRGYIIHAIIEDKQGKVVENFTAYTYPGILPGNAFAFNSHGKIFTVNALYPKLVKPNQMARAVLSRAMISVHSRQELEDLFSSEKFGVAYGFNVNFADLMNSTQTFVNYEITPQTSSQKSLTGRREVGLNKYYFHFNMFEILNRPQFSHSIVSSKHRKSRAQSLPIPTDIQTALNILGDTSDTKYPIYRSPRPTDKESTEATAVFDVLHCYLHIYKTNPKTGQPLLTLSLPRGPLCLP